MASRRPNVLVVMTDQERYPPPYESEALRRWRRDRLPARERIRTSGAELHRHYAAATACLPSRASLFCGQYPSLHGVRSTDGLGKDASDPAMHFLDPDAVPTAGDWFRAAGYRSMYRGKWHISHADLVVPGTHTSIATNRRDGTVLAEAVEAYRRADRLDPYGFSGWIGREPHGADPADSGFVRDDLFADQVCELFAQLARDGDDRPWFTVASLVNPHDIVFSGAGWEVLGMPPVPDDGPPSIEAAPSQDDPLDDRPSAHRDWVRSWPSLVYPQPTDEAYRRFYHWLHEVVDRAIDRILDGLEAHGLAENTIVVFTSDHGEMLGAHGGLQQKWHNAYDETIRVPLWVSGPGIEPGMQHHLPTSHVDLLPTLLGLVGASSEALAPLVAERHYETQPLVGRDLSGLLTGRERAEELDAPVYFMTEDAIERGLHDVNRFNGRPVHVVAEPASVESVVCRLPAEATDTSDESVLWKLNRYYDSRTDRSAGDHADAPAPQWELHDLTHDPEERVNRAGDPDAPLAALTEVLDAERRRARRRPALGNPRPG
jgi:arylsulfatase A-like enzyme